MPGQSNTKATAMWVWKSRDKHTPKTCTHHTCADDCPLDAACPGRLIGVSKAWGRMLQTKLNKTNYRHHKIKDTNAAPAKEQLHDPRGQDQTWLVGIQTLKLRSRNRRQASSPTQCQRKTKQLPSEKPPTTCAHGKICFVETNEPTPNPWLIFVLQMNEGAEPSRAPTLYLCCVSPGLEAVALVIGDSCMMMQPCRNHHAYAGTTQESDERYQFAPRSR